MKAYTDLGQSKVLAVILPLESADMCYKCIDDDPYDIVCKPYSEWKEEYKGLLIRGDANVIPCWSLAALLGLIPEYIKFNDHTWKFYLDHCGMYYMNADTYDTNTFSTNSENPVDACYEMILKLHELKML